MTSAIHRSPARRRPGSTQLSAKQIDELLKESQALGSTLRKERRTSDPATTLAHPAGRAYAAELKTAPVPESVRILQELVDSEATYLSELRALKQTVVAPKRRSQVFVSTVSGVPTSPVRPKIARPLDLEQHLRNPMLPDHLERSFRCIEGMVNAHTCLLQMFEGARSEYELLSHLLSAFNSLLSLYKTFTSSLPHLSQQLRESTDNGLGAYSRFLAPMQRAVRYELLLRRLQGVLIAENASAEYQHLTAKTLRTSEFFCRQLEQSQSEEQDHIYLQALCTILEIQPNGRKLIFEGAVDVLPLSSKKPCKLGYVCLLSDGSLFWAEQREPNAKAWQTEQLKRVEEGGYLDLIIYSEHIKSGKVKEVKRALGFPSVRTSSINGGNTSPSKTPSISSRTSSPSKTHKRNSLSSLFFSSGASKLDFKQYESKPMPVRQATGDLVEDWLAVGRQLAVKTHVSKRQSMYGIDLAQLEDKMRDHEPYGPRLHTAPPTRSGHWI
ncbi:hypothetical protein BCR37DRAFT_37412 [Protomyces lactucae-debilis]|uniref:DH domain-containing protein n=1 Tax=Protomyces lactucae-debilis TaxID=2754530 RepID=A0A1Y2FDY7_PROLT|nr:uncharacterized protein BCR37DRAFT_37412 [Protomyces lactucae-debilis]ORY82131.1 hypothetical protein BCR37DRAFT_37412 [Protomyces lactucae-debilis]